MKYDDLLTLEQIAEILQVPVSTVRAWLHRRQLKGVKLRSIWRVRKTDLEDFVKEVERDDGANFITQRILVTPAGQIFFANFYKDRVEEVEEDYSEFPAPIQDYFRFNKKYNITPEVKDFFTIPKNHPVND